MRLIRISLRFTCTSSFRDLGLYDQAAETAKEIKALEPDNSDGYLFLGLSQCMKGKKKEGLENLQKAKELGYPQADELIEKYAK